MGHDQRRVDNCVYLFVYFTSNFQLFFIDKTREQTKITRDNRERRTQFKSQSIRHSVSAIIPDVADSTAYPREQDPVADPRTRLRTCGHKQCS